jgi:hypothetical protein
MTFSAIAVAPIYAEVAASVQMATRTVRASGKSSRYSLSANEIFASSHGLQVIWIDARTITALVVNI